MEQLSQVLRNYHVYPVHVEGITNRVFKVSDGNRNYALKQSRLSTESLPVWEEVFQLAYMNQLTAIVPVYLTKNNSLYSVVDSQLYYLQPWMNHNDSLEKKGIIKPLYRTIGQIHAKTKIAKSFQYQEVIDQFKPFRLFCSHMQKKLVAAVDMFEQSHYMSPFELQVCTHFRDIENALQKIDNRIGQFVEIENQDHQWDISLCHGNLSFDHIIYNDRCYLINWEKSRMDNAIMDLVSFYNNQTWKYNAPDEELIESFSSYFQENELSNMELLILSIYLLNPAPYFELVDRYMKNPSNDTMVNQVRNLEFTYRKLVFGLKWTMYVEEEYETISMDDLDLES